MKNAVRTFSVEVVIAIVLMIVVACCTVTAFVVWRLVVTGTPVPCIDPRPAIDRPIATYTHKGAA